MLTLGTPLFLLGLLSAAIPLLIHLSRSRRTRKMPFSTTRFFTEQFLRSYRMSRLKELLLLACRMALCAGLALALAAPVWHAHGKGLWGEPSRAVVLVLDDSASMALEVEGRTLFSRAQQAAHAILDSLRPSDSAALVLAGRRANGCEVPFAEATPQLADVRQLLDGLQPAMLSADLSEAIARAHELLRRHTASSREIYVLSDLQAPGISGQAHPPPAADAGVPVFFVRIRPAPLTGLAVTALQYGASRPMAGVPFAVRAHVRNLSTASLPGTVRLVVAGRVVAERRLPPIAAGRWAVATLHHTFTTTGWHEGYVEVADEAFEPDNRRWFAFQVLDRVAVLAVNGAPSQVPRLDELFFLRAALGVAKEQAAAWPHQGAPDRAASATAAANGESGQPAPSAGIVLRTFRADELGSAELGPYRAVILANVESLPEAAVARLERFVDAGGGLLVFLGDAVNVSAYNQTLAAQDRLHGGLLPARLLGIEGRSAAVAAEGGAADSQPIARLARLDAEHPALAGLEQGAAGNAWAANIRSLWTVDPGNSRVLMAADTGSPLLCEKPYGRGRVLLCALPCDRDWSDFPLRPVWVPWLYRLLAYLAQEPLAARGFYLTGAQVEIAASATASSKRWVVRTPDGRVRPTIPATEGPPRSLFSETEQIGVYRAYPVAAEKLGERFAVNLESYESDRRYLDEELAGDDASAASRRITEGLARLLGVQSEVYYVERPEAAVEAALAARRGIRLWDAILAVALLAALADAWLANRISRRHYAQPREISLQPGGRVMSPAPPRVASEQVRQP
jgi:hypothetical protein